MQGSPLWKMKIVKGIQQKAELANAKLYLSKKSITISKASSKTECSTCKNQIETDEDVSICNKCGSAHHITCANDSKRCGACGAVFEIASELERDTELEAVRNEGKRKPLSDAAVTFTIAAEKGRCSLCNGKIKKESHIAICRVCKSVEHELCAKAIRKCGNCDVNFES